MRWFEKNINNSSAHSPTLPKLGDTYISENEFMFLPETIGKETRWLEYATIEYTYKYKFNMRINRKMLMWVATKFINN